MSIEIVDGYQRISEVADLFREYTDALVAKFPQIQVVLDVQGFDAELADIKTRYKLPDSRIYLALKDNQLAGCVALGKIDDQYCELKRVYVRPHFRGLGISTLLCNKVINEARKIGYEYIRLDTFRGMQPASRLYASLGFYEIPKYYANPLENSAYYELKLSSD